MTSIQLTLNPRDRLELSNTIERLINLMDDLDGDPDLEPDLGWNDHRGTDLETDDDREEENEHGGDINDEPHDWDERELDPAEDSFGVIWGGQGV